MPISGTVNGTDPRNDERHGVRRDGRGKRHQGQPEAKALIVVSPVNASLGELLVDPSAQLSNAPW
jgi:hypothetical protein